MGGEPGMMQSPHQGANQLVDRCLDAIVGGEKHVYLPLSPGGEVAIMVNNLGENSNSHLNLNLNLNFNPKP